MYSRSSQLVWLLKLDRFSLWPRINGCWIPISMRQAVFGMC